MDSTMQLNLRKMLRYLDDRLKPQEADAVAETISRDNSALLLLGRIRHVACRIRLGAPEWSGPEGMDPNMVAEYLDGQMPDDRALDFEEVCMASDVLLAETSACHHLLAELPETAPLISSDTRLRMYALAKSVNDTPPNAKPKDRLPPAFLDHPHATYPLPPTTEITTGPLIEPSSTETVFTPAKATVPLTISFPTLLRPSPFRPYPETTSAVPVETVRASQHRPAAAWGKWVVIGCVAACGVMMLGGATIALAVTQDKWRPWVAQQLMPNHGVPGPEQPAVALQTNKLKKPTVEHWPEKIGGLMKSNGPAPGYEEQEKPPLQQPWNAVPVNEVREAWQLIPSDALAAATALPSNPAADQVAETPPDVQIRQVEFTREGPARATIAPVHPAAVNSLGQANSPVVSAFSTGAPAPAAVAETPRSKPALQPNPSAEARPQFPPSSAPPPGLTPDQVSIARNPTPRPSQNFPPIAAPPVVVPPTVAPPVSPPAVVQQEKIPDELFPLAAADPNRPPMEVGKVVSQGQMLLVKEQLSGRWEWKGDNGPLRANSWLTAPPLCRPAVATLDGMVMELLPDTLAYVSVEDQHLQVKVLFGRIVLYGHARAQGVWVEAGGWRGLVLLKDEQDLTAFEVRPFRMGGSDPVHSEPQAAVDLYAARGKCVVRQGEHVKELPAPMRAIVLELPGEDAEAQSRTPLWAMKPEEISAEERWATSTLIQRMTPNAPVLPILQQTTRDENNRLRLLAALWLGYLGEFQPLVGILNEPGFQTQARLLALQSLTGSLARGPGWAKQVHRACVEQRGPQGEVISRLLWGFSSAQWNQRIQEQLLADADHPQLDLRVLSFWNLERRNGPFPVYLPDAAAEQRAAGLQRLRESLTSPSPE